MEGKPQEPTTAAEGTTGAETKKQLLADVKKQIEYYLSDNNLKHDEFFYKTIKESQTVSYDLFSSSNIIRALSPSKLFLNATRSSSSMYLRMKSWKLLETLKKLKQLVTVMPSRERTIVIYQNLSLRSLKKSRLIKNQNKMMMVLLPLNRKCKEFS